MKTLLGTPDHEWRPVYGVKWGGHQEPLCDYDELSEAEGVAEATGGRVMVRWVARTDWGVL